MCRIVGDEPKEHKPSHCPIVEFPKAGGRHFMYSIAMNDALRSEDDAYCI
jgi:hypothetical protein